MSKALSFDAILTSLSSRSDRSLGLRLVTPELSATEAVAFMELQNRNLKVLVQPVDDGPPDELVNVAKELAFKTPSQRLRGVLFKRFAQEKPDEIFETWYLRVMETILDDQKRRLDTS